MKRIILIFLFIGLYIFVGAQNISQKKQALSFVPIDSVMMLNIMNDTKLNQALSIETTQKLLLFPSITMSKKKFKQQIKKWNQRAKDSLNLLYGTNDISNGTQQFISGIETIKMAAPLFLNTADAQYMKAIETILMNNVEAALSGYFSPQTTASAGIAKFSAISYTYATDNEGIYINLFENSNAIITTRNFSYLIDQVSSMPWLNKNVIRVNYRKGNQNIKLHIRIPEWSLNANLQSKYEQKQQSLPTLFVNGKEYPYKAINGYAIVERTWNNGDELFWNFEIPCSIVSNKNGQQALMRGPILYTPSDNLQPKTYVYQDSLKEDFTQNFVRIRGYIHAKAKKPILFLPYSESFTWSGKTDVWTSIKQ